MLDIIIDFYNQTGFCQYDLGTVLNARSIIILTLLGD